MKDFVKQAIRTEAPISDDVLLRMGRHARFIHAIFGMITEVGEFTDQMKRAIFYGKAVDYVNLEEELGDLFWYIAVALDCMGHKDPSNIMERIIAKLRKRFPEKFTEDNAMIRDLDAERKILEGQKTAHHQDEEEMLSLEDRKHFDNLDVERKILENPIRSMDFCPPEGIEPELQGIKPERLVETKEVPKKPLRSDRDQLIYNFGVHHVLQEIESFKTDFRGMMNRTASEEDIDLYLYRWLKSGKSTL